MAKVIEKDNGKINEKVNEGEKSMEKTAEKELEQMDIGKLKDMKMSELTKVAREMNINGMRIQVVDGKVRVLNNGAAFADGQSVSLKDRFRSYLREERGHEHARQQLYSLFRDFPGRVFFTFAAVSATKRKATEDALLEALTPPLKTRLPATIARAERAF